MSLATKYRPKTFEDVCGQNITVDLLKKAIEQNKFSNAILFAGTTGCGKTTLARIFHNKINKGLGEPIEMDAASMGRGDDKGGVVDAVKSIVDSASQRALVGEYKVFIIDECHALSTSQAAWQAFLKGIEECPKYTVFIFCTTEPNKVPATILNRVQRFNILPISSDKIKNRLEYICRQEGFTNFEKTCDLISKSCGSSMRNAVTTLERCANFSTNLDFSIIKQVLGNSNYESMYNLTEAIKQKNDKKIIEVIEGIYNNGQDIKNFMSVYLDFISDLVKYILFNDLSMTTIPEYLATPDNQVIQSLVSNVNLNYFKKLAEYILNIKQVIKYDNNYKSTIEIMLINFNFGE